MFVALNETLFFDLNHARQAIGEWLTDYNLQRPHSSLGYLTPAAFAAHLTETGDQLHNLDRLRRSLVAQPASDGAKSAVALTPLDDKSVAGQSAPSEC